LLTLSLLSHAATAPSAAIAVLLDCLHLAAMVAWLGGLIPLAWSIRAARRNPDPSIRQDSAGKRALEQALPLALLIPRFSWITVPCVGILALTGTYGYLLHVGRLDLLAATTYGRALLIKLGLFGVLLLLGGLNLFILTRPLRETGDRPARLLGRSVRIELIAGAALLLAAGAMTSVAPSKAAWEAHEQQGMAMPATVGEVDLTLRIAPAQVGDNEFAVDVVDRRPGAAAAPPRGLPRFDMLGMDVSELQAEGRPAAPGGSTP